MPSPGARQHFHDCLTKLGIKCRYMDAFNTLKAKIERRLELEKQVRAIVLEIREVDKVLKVEAEYTDLCKSLGKTMAARLKRNSALTSWERLAMPSTSERKRALERLYDRSFKKRPQNAEDTEWSDYLHDHLVRVEHTRHKEIAEAAGVVTDHANKTLKDSDKNRSAAIEMTARMEKLVEEEMELASIDFEIKPLLVEELARTEAKVIERERAARLARERILTMLTLSLDDFSSGKAGQSISDLKELVRTLNRLRKHLSKADPEERELSKSIDVLISQCRSRFKDEQYSNEDDKKEKTQRKRLELMMWHCDMTLQDKELVDNKIKGLFEWIREIKEEKDSLDTHNPANQETIKKTDAFLDRLVQTLEEIVKLRGEWEKLKSEDRNSHERIIL